MHSMDEMMRAGCATRRAIRLWEDEGLLGEVARTDGDTRRYTAEQLNRAKIIAAGQFGNFSLATIKEMIDEYGMEVYDALTTRLSDQMRLAARLAEALPNPAPLEYDL